MKQVKVPRRKYGGLGTVMGIASSLAMVIPIFTLLPLSAVMSSPLVYHVVLFVLVPSVLGLARDAARFDKKISLAREQRVPRVAAQVKRMIAQAHEPMVN